MHATEAFQSVFFLSRMRALSLHIYVHSSAKYGEYHEWTYLLDNGILLFQIKVEENAIKEIQVVGLKANEEFTVTSGILSSFSF